MTKSKANFGARTSMLAIAGAPAIWSPATAQTVATAQSDDGGGEVTEIVVTAQFREQKRQDVPITITAVIHVVRRQEIRPRLLWILGRISMLDQEISYV